jgi:hypothetical protein
MKYFTIPLCFLLFYSCSKKESNVVTPTTPSKEQTSVKNSTISLQVPGISPSEIGSAVNGSVSGTTLYTKEGVEHLIISPTLFFNEPLIPAIHLIKKIMNGYTNLVIQKGQWVQAEIVKFLIM